MFLSENIIFSENIAILHSNNNFFTQYLFLKKVSFDDFFMTMWEQENESVRKKELQIPRLTDLVNVVEHTIGYQIFMLTPLWCS